MSQEAGTRVALLDAMENTPASARLREHTYRLLAVDAGDVVLDVGCGTGRAVAELTQLGRRAIGLDTDEDILALARDRWPGAEFQAADATALPSADGSVRGYRAEKMLHGLTDPAAGLAEAHRVLAPGGRIVLTDQDWASVTVPGLSPAADRLTELIMAARADSTPSPRLPERYPELLDAAGFTDIQIERRGLPMPEPIGARVLARAAEAAAEAGRADPVDIDHWRAAVIARGQTRHVPATLPMVLASARRP